MLEHTLVRNRMDVTNVIQLLYRIRVLFYILEHTLGRKHINATDVIRLLHRKVTL